MHKEVRDIIGLLTIMLPLIALVIVGWYYSPMYLNHMEAQRFNAQMYLINTEYDSQTMVDRQQLIDQFNFTDDEITSKGTLDAMIEYFEAQDEKVN